ncbi:hypothetical protein SAMN02745704_02434 [Paucidesulfovibrio gracilis DSM 16080]|uniref:Uncharacterized protein n=1 Tax=Paucidesulfovibrio gracilis DSM 16080 TaxID=1121449 RepID=A0A1T4XSX3_9BACT|nr:hypothetical protein [Paucidesulfovibrio gracilis]SKA92640.1 hypothetical protein SAMN02745704_02434 [Paucidesulfovibrio gracilis DSM 16080]
MKLILLQRDSNGNLPSPAELRAQGLWVSRACDPEADQPSLEADEKGSHENEESIRKAKRHLAGVVLTDPKGK